MPHHYTPKYLAFLLCCLIAITSLIRVTVINIDWVSSGSMLPNHPVDSRLISNHLTWGLNLPFMNRLLVQWRRPERGDVVLFHNPFDDNNIWMKRVVGIAGDTIHFRERQLYVNGIACTSKTENREKLPTASGSFTREYKLWRSYLENDWGPVTIPEGKLFLLGDHRGASIDSRTWGPVPEESLIGKPIARIWPLSKIQWLP